MALPKVLKNMNLFIDGQGFVGQIPEVSIPKLARKMEGYRGAGMDGELMLDMGGEPVEFEWKAGGLIEQIYAQFGATRHDAVQLRWLGAYQSDDTGQVTAAEVVVRGRHQEIDPGTGKPGDKGEKSVKTVCSYYKLVVAGRTLVEIDTAGMIFLVDGVDRLAEQRAAIGA